MYCRKCGAQIDDEAYVCVHCGALVKEPTETAAGNVENRQKKTNGMAIAGFVCSFFLPVLGLIFSIIAMKQCEERGCDGYGLAKAGKIISIVCLVLNVFIGIICGVAMAAVVNTYY